MRIAQYTTMFVMVHTLAFANNTPTGPIYSDGDIVVTATKEGKAKLKSAESIDKITQEIIEKTSPTHPADVANKVAGVHVVNLGGEGHMTSIRQPISTSGLYLYLEDGLPTRPAGFFNHNALYEINVPQAGALEITKGPGSSLYGSEAIGGVINSITEPSPEGFEFKINSELGSYGWKRVLTSIGDYSDEINTGFRLNLNVTDNDGYQEKSPFSRQSISLRTDTFANDSLSIKNIISYTNVNQSGVSGLESAELAANRRDNLYHGDIGAREVYALRISSEWHYEPNKYDALTVTPFFRDNSLSLMPSWQLSYSPEVWDTDFQSYGLLAKYRRNIPSLNAKVITGVDIDYSPSNTTANDITAIADSTGTYRDYNVGTRVYDFDANQLGISPYIHAEAEIVKDLTLHAGLRYDYFHMDYTDNLDPYISTSQFNTGLGRSVTRNRPDSGNTEFDHFSPKFGLNYNIDKTHSLYANYRHSFRTPSASSLYRSGSTTNTDQLDPTKVDSFEVGTKGQINSKHGYEVALYHMTVSNDVVRYFDISGDRLTTNAGETTHKGIELTLYGQISPELSYRAAGSYARHKYEDFNYQCGSFSSPQNCNYAGFDVGKAPETLANIALNYKPSWVPKLNLEAEYVHVGGYFTDETNTGQYDGHDLLNLRGQYQINDNIGAYINLMNVGNADYAYYASGEASSTSFRPGMPFAVFGGLRIKFSE